MMALIIFPLTFTAIHSLCLFVCFVLQTGRSEHLRGHSSLWLAGTCQVSLAMTLYSSSVLCLQSQHKTSSWVFSLYHNTYQMSFISINVFQEWLAQAMFLIFHNLICAHPCADTVLQTLRRKLRLSMEYWHNLHWREALTARQQESWMGYRWQQSWSTSKRKISLLCLPPVDGAVQLLHLVVSEDTVSEVRLELRQGQLPVIWKETVKITTGCSLKGVIPQMRSFFII